MRATHTRSWQTCAGIALSALGFGCTTAPEPESVWPPADFRVSLQEFAIDTRDMRVERAFRVRADGLAVFATISDEIVDTVSGARLPVPGRMCIYRLVPTCTRALARRLYRSGLLDVDAHQGEEDEALVGTRLAWTAFANDKVVTSRGRAHGAVAEALAILVAHMPAGETLATPGVEERNVPAVVRGAPAPIDDPAAALVALLDLVDGSPKDRELVLDAFALACSLGRREVASAMLELWTQAAPPAANDAAEGPRLTPEILGRMLP
ncbi:MAG: hypothetical protein U1E73_05070 [Planctomycetota bacterium]